MSIQDESFPYDDDLDLLELSRNSGKNFAFPHHKPRRRSLAAAESKELCTPDAEQTINLVCNATANNTSPASTPNQDESTQSSNGCTAESETSGKTNASEPTDLQETQSKKTEFMRNPQSKAVSYQDIHSEYTKRRYKHVESKVGQYIANIKALDEKRRKPGNFQRHRSMPETLAIGSSTAANDIDSDNKKCGLLRHSTNDLLSDHRHHHHNNLDLLQSDTETENCDNFTTTTTSNSSSTREAMMLAASQDAGIFIDKPTYKQLINSKERSEYLQSKLDEKNSEMWRLKKNLDTMRIEYTLCKDKLKQYQNTQRLTGSFGSFATVGALGRTSLQSLLYVDGANVGNKNDKSTQTVTVLTPSPVPPLINANEMYAATPLTPESHNNSMDHAAVGILAPAALKQARTIATIQPISLNFSNIMEQDSRDYSNNNTMGFLRQRSNSIAARKKSTPLHALNNTKASGRSACSSMPSSSDSAIDIEVSESPSKQRSNKLQKNREEFIYFDQRSQRYSVLETRSANSSTQNDSGTSSNMAGGGSASGAVVRDRNRYSRRKRHTLKNRVMRLFGVCTKCDDPNITVDSGGNSQQSFSQIPLLEKSSVENHCRNIR